MCVHASLFCACVWIENANLEMGGDTERSKKVMPNLFSQKRLEKKIPLKHLTRKNYYHLFLINFIRESRPTHVDRHKKRVTPNAVVVFGKGKR